MYTHKHKCATAFIYLHKGKHKYFNTNMLTCSNTHRPALTDMHTQTSKHPPKYKHILISAKRQIVTNKQKCMYQHTFTLQDINFYMYVLKSMIVHAHINLYSQIYMHQHAQMNQYGGTHKQTNSNRSIHYNQQTRKIV